MRRNLWLVAATSLAFSGALAAPFILDDFSLFSDRVITSPDGWLHSWSVLQSRPLTWFTYWLNYRSGAETAWGYHLVNFLLHLVSVCLVRDVLRRLIPESAALLAAALFALHPIQTEAVVYIFARATLLMTLFCLLSLRSWVLGQHWRAVLWFVPALLAKEECLAFPIFLLLLHLSISRNQKEWSPIGVMLALSFAAGLRVLYATSVIAGSGAGGQSGVSPSAYFLTQGVALWRYVRLLVLPYGFTIDSPVELAGIAGIAGWLALAAAMLLAARRFAKAREGFWMIAAFVLIAPSSSIFPAADLAADRRVYLPLVAVAAALGLFLHTRPQWIGLSLSIALALISLRQTILWHSGESLWREAVRLSPRKARPRIQLARYVAPKQAIQLLDEARTLAPSDPAVASEKGKVLLDSGNPQLALAEFGRALALAPSDPRAVNNRGVALLRLNQNEAAVADFRRALTLDPCLFDAFWNLRAAGIKEAPPSSCRYTPQQRTALEDIR